MKRTQTMHRPGSKLATVVLLFAILLSLSTTATAAEPEGWGECDRDRLQASGAVYRICMPPAPDWNGDLVIFAHGYVAEGEPIEIPEDQLVLPDGTSIPGLINALGFAFATTSYSANGLAVQEGMADVVDLVGLFGDAYGQPGHVYLVGASEGGLVTTLSVEQHADLFDGGLATCGPVGNFRGQTNYFGDARVLFDYFFPGVLPGSPVDIPQPLIDNWESVYEPAVEAALRADPYTAKQFATVARIPLAAGDPEAGLEGMIRVLWYNVFATNDATAKLGGRPFGNRLRFYTGSDNDWHLNRHVQRFRSEPAAIDEIRATLQTSGALTAPLVNLHTLQDPVVPYWHELLYQAKVALHGAGALHTNLPGMNYGHCNFTPREVLVAFSLLVGQVTGTELQDIDQVLEDVAGRR